MLSSVNHLFLLLLSNGMTGHKGRQERILGYHKHVVSDDLNHPLSTTDFICIWVQVPSLITEKQTHDNTSFGNPTAHSLEIQQLDPDNEPGLLSFFPHPNVSLLTNMPTDTTEPAHKSTTRPEKGTKGKARAKD
jgi:hypothetical protein